MAPRHQVVFVLLSAFVLGTAGGLTYLVWPMPDKSNRTEISAPVTPSPKTTKLQSRPDPSPEAIRDAEAAMKEGLAAYDRADYQAALRVFTFLAVNDIGTKHYMSEAYYRLGLLHAFGLGDWARAMSHYAVAAELGHVKAQLRLSEAYYSTIGVPFDYVRAYMWSTIAARLVRDAYDSDVAIGNRDDLAEFMTAADVFKAERLAREWLAKFEKQDTGRLRAFGGGNR